MLAKHRDVVGRGVVRAPSAGGTVARVLAKHRDVVGRGFIPENPYHLWRHRWRAMLTMYSSAFLARGAQPS